MSGAAEQTRLRSGTNPPIRQSTSSAAAGNVVLVLLGHFGFLFVAFVEVETIAEGDALAGRHFQIAGGLVLEFFKIVLPERIGSK